MTRGIDNPDLLAPPIERAKDGCYHPSSEQEIIELIRHARAAKKQLRVFGSSHSVVRAIVTDRFAGKNTPEDEMQLVLDRYQRIFPPRPDPDHPGMMLVEVEAGCHLGLSPCRITQARIEPGGPSVTDVRAPSPWHSGRWEQSLNYQLHHRYGLALPDLGGITHQTVSGFLSTGSSGGTVKWSAHEAVVAMRLIDGEGRVHILERGGENEELFRAAGVSLGLLGVISTITFRCIPRYDVVGSETISATRLSEQIDFYADRPESGLPELDRYLVEAEYTRLMWWPQYEFDRLVVWEARRAPFDAERKIRPYKEIAFLPVVSQVLASYLYTILGNLDDPSRIPLALREVREHPDVPMAMEAARARAIPFDPARPPEPQGLVAYLSALLERLIFARRDPVTLGAAWVALVDFFVVTSEALLIEMMKLPIIKRLFARLAKLVPEHIGTILSLFVTTGKNGAPARQEFADRWFLGLPMDNQMDDLLMPTWFTEAFIPFEVGDGRVNAVIKKLRELFDADGTPEGAYATTGSFCVDIYAARAESEFMLSPALGEKHAFRVDLFWFAKNAADPVRDFFPILWEALEGFGARYHWGKFLPPPGAMGADALVRSYPDWPRFEELRRELDPGGVFLTDYFRKHLGIG